MSYPFREAHSRRERLTALSIFDVTVDACLPRPNLEALATEPAQTHQWNGKDMLLLQGFVLPRQAIEVFQLSILEKLTLEVTQL